MACTSGCPTQDCPSYGACMRRKGIATTGLESTGPGFARNVQKAWDAELDAYADAKRQGIQPAGTSMAAVRDALEKSDATGTAYNAEA